MTAKLKGRSPRPNLPWPRESQPRVSFPVISDAKSFPSTRIHKSARQNLPPVGFMHRIVISEASFRPGRPTTAQQCQQVPFPVIDKKLRQRRSLNRNQFQGAECSDLRAVHSYQMRWLGANPGKGLRRACLAFRGQGASARCVWARGPAVALGRRGAGT